MSINFLAPGAFFLGLLLPVIIALYLLKLKRTEREVPSTYLWRKMVRDVEANAPWQRLRPNLLMILQLLFLAALIFALTRPFTWVEGSGGQAAILILDTSASMAATDVTPSRIESAKQRALQLVDDLPDAARVTVIEAGPEARVLISSSLDRRQAHLAIQAIQAGTSGSDMSTALELASAIAARQPGTEIIVLSDGRVELPQRMSIKGALRYIPFGLNGDNQAISLLTLEPAAAVSADTAAAGGSGAAQDTGAQNSATGSLTAFVQISNYGEKPVSRRLTLLADGLLVNAYDLVDIPAGGQKSVIAEGLPPQTQMIEAQLDGKDTLPLDDKAIAVRPETQPVPVTLVTQGNLFIKTALSLLPGVQLTEQDLGAPAAENAGPTPTTAPTAVPTATPTTAPTPVSGTAKPAALTILDNYIPDVLPTEGSLLFIAPPKSTDLFTTTGVVQEPSPRTVDPSDPLMTNVSLNQISILDAVNIPLPEWATPVVAGDLKGQNVPLIFRGEVNGRRIAVIAFDLRHSDLPLQIAFPVLWSNLVDWLAPGARNPIPAQVNPGETLAFNAPDGTQSAEVTRPDGSRAPLTAENGRFVFPDTTQLGEYRVSFQPASGSKTAPGEATFSVNLFSPKESSLKPANNLPNLSAQGAQAGTAPQKSMREWWRPLALLALGLLIGEWLVYQRSALSRIKDAAQRVFRKS